MPYLTDEQKTILLQRQGLNPDEWDLDNNFSLSPKVPKQSPPISTTPLSPQSPEMAQPKSNTVLSTFAKSAAESALPSFGAGLGAGAGMLLAPETGGLSLLLPLLGALGGGIGTRKLQSMVEPQAWQQNVSQAQQEHPIAGILGGLSTIPLGGLNPSPTVLGKAGTGLVKALTPGMRMLPEEASSLANVGIGAGLGAAIPAGESLIHGQMPNLQDILINAAAGGLFNNPNAIGRALKFTSPLEIPRALPGIQETQALGKERPLTTGIERPNLDLGQVGGAPAEREADLFKQIAQNKYSGNIGEQPFGTTKAKTEIVTPNEEALSRLEGEGGPPLKEPEKLTTGINPDEIIAERLELNAKVKEIERQNQALRDNLSKLETVPKESEPLTSLPKVGQTENLPGEVASPKYSETSSLQPTEFEKETAAKLKERGISPQPTSVWTDMLKKFGAIKRNTEVQNDGTVVNSLTGKPVAGSAEFSKSLGKYLVKLNPEKAMLDTGPHELAGHVFLDTLRNSPKKSDRDFVTRFENLVSNSDEFKSLNQARLNAGEKAWSPEEYIATQQGHEFLRRQLNLSGESSFKTFWKDLWSHIKTRFSPENATNEDYRRMLQYKFQNDPAFHDLYKTGVKINNPVKGVQYSDESSLRRQGKEGVTKYPFTMKELSKNDILENERNKRLYNLSNEIGYGIQKALESKGIKLGSYESFDTIRTEKGRELLRKAIGDLDAEEFIKKGDEFLKLETQKQELDKFNSVQNQEESSLGKPEERGFALSKQGNIENIDRGQLFKDAQEYDNLVKSIRSISKKGEGESIQDNMLKLEAKYNGMDPRVVYRELNNLKKGESLFNSGMEGKFQEESFLGKPEKQSFIPLLTSRIDKIKEALPGNKTANELADNLHKFAGASDLYSARIGQGLIAPTKDYSKEEINRVYRHQFDKDAGDESLISLTPREQTLADKITEILRQPRYQQIEKGLKVQEGNGNYRVAGIKPEGYMFNIIDPKVPYEWATKPNSVLSKSYDEAYINHLIKKGVDPVEAEKQLEEYKTALGNNVTQDVEYGALRKAENYGLPWELVDKNFNSAAMRYGKRAGRDLAYFEHIQSDPRMLKALSLKDQYGNKVPSDAEPDVEYLGRNPAVKDAMRSVFGVDTFQNQKALSAARVIANSVMGPGTALRNIVQMPAQIATYVQGKQLPLAIKALGHMNDSRIRAFENGATRATYADYDAAGYYEGNPDPTVRLANRLSDFMRKYTGRNLSDKFEGEYYYSLGELLATDNVARARLGDKEALHFVNRFGDIVEGGPERLLAKDTVLTQDDISRIAKRFVDAARGTYGPEGLPSGAIEGAFAPFTALSRWSIEKSNTVWKDVIQPMKKGIYGPFLRYVLGAAGSGFLVEQLNEMLNNKRGPEPKINEVIASGNEGDLMAKAISILQLASFAGIVGDGAQLASNVIRKRSLKYSQPLSFPMYSWLTDTVAGNMSGAASALRNGEDPFQVMTHFLTQLSTGSVQAMRYLDAYANPEDTARKEKFRDYNIWQELTGRKEPQADTGSVADSYTNLGAKEFKRETDLSKAGGELSALFNKALESSKDPKTGNIDPERLNSELRKIKQNSYQTMPDFEREPIAFMQYRQHLIDTLGQKEAENRIADYIRTRELNKIKSEMVPTL